jgi:hypothetical protein
VRLGVEVWGVWGWGPMNLRPEQEGEELNACLFGGANGRKHPKVKKDTINSKNITLIIITFASHARHQRKHTKE